jgi:hypothetical protein
LRKLARGFDQSRAAKSGGELFQYRSKLVDENPRRYFKIDLAAFAAWIGRFDD